MAMDHTTGLCRTCVKCTQVKVCEHRENYEARGWCRFHMTAEDKNTRRVEYLRSDFKNFKKN